MKKTDACVSVVQVENRSFLQIGKESVEIAGYKFASSDDGTVSITVTIEAASREVALSASLTTQKRSTR